MDTRLELIRQHIHLYEPVSSAAAPDSSPALVILCTWVGGSTPRRINKYVAQYRQMYPGACILLLTTSFSDMFRPFSMLRARLKPAGRAIRRVLTSRGSRGTLLHLFSHGGGNIAVQLALSLKEEEDAGTAFFSSLRGIILDCCPGDDTLHRAIGATRMSVPQTTVAQVLERAFLSPTVTVVNRLQHAGVLRSVRDLRALLLDASTFGTKPRRLYIYSKEDVMVGWEDVQMHVEDARALGYSAQELVFEHGQHCGLVMEDPDRYWTVVQRFWRGEDSERDADHNSKTSPPLRSRL
ncbi:hypothetical protein N7510_001309 [Penicillium lagena]|uniref:uncharacterized protein n=1 Tax=Penicillium lagena TaxID=94218 RepID=UPI00254017EE|nr:uncharacterized protein N7510_001309 [Penicillium lagena]KAJ5625000.1 hypothetical protein N7510_001309 [Penicillium lagena]